MTVALAAISHHRRSSPDNKMRTGMGHFLRRCAIAAFALGLLAGLPVTGIAASVISRADDNCASGWYWNADLNQCVFWLPAAMDPADPGGPGGPGGPGRH
jgi:hypothetical protein